MRSGKVTLSFLVPFFLVITLLTTTSCKVGLGDAVDTQVPTVSMQTPPVDAIIKDKFAIGGDWSDDTEVSSVKISLRRTDGNKASKAGITFEGNIKTDASGKGTWSCLIDPFSKDTPVKDGKYEIEAVAYDTAGHSTRETRLITIDNTPPLIILDRPATKDGTDIKFLDAYGQKLSLLGRAADDNEVDSIEINFYKDGDETKPVHTVRKDGVSNTIDETVALFRDPSQENNQYFDNYDKIYGSVKDDTKYYTCSIKAYDKARKYPESYPYSKEEINNDKLGNGVDHYYLYKDLSDNLLKNYSVSDLYKMTSGNYVPESVAKTATGFSVEQVLAALDSPLLKVQKGKFSLNPENNPYYAISGFSKIDSYDQFDKTNYTIENHGQLFIDVYPGIDGYALYDLPFEDHYRVVMYPCSKGESGKIVIDEDNLKVISKKNIEVKPQGNGYKLVVSLHKDDIGNFGNYIFRIGGVEKAEDGTETYLPFGKDKVGNDFIVKYKEKTKVDDSDIETEKEIGGEGIQYGFRFVPAGAAPKLNVDDITYNYYKKDSSLIIHGFMDIEDGLPTLTIKLGNRKDVILNLENTYEKNKDSFLKTAAQANLGYEFRHVFNGLNSTDTKVIVTADGGTKYNTEKEMTVNYDEEPPVGSVKYEPCAYKGSDGAEWYKTTQIKVGLVDVVENGSGISSIRAGLKGDDLIVLNPKTTENGVAYYEGFVSFVKQGMNTMSFELTDKAGNKTVYDKTVYIDSLSPAYKDVNIITIDNEPGNEVKVKLVNGDKPVTVVINAKDASEDEDSETINSSGIKKIQLSNILGNTTTGIVQTKHDEGNINQYTLTISTDILKKLEGSGPVFFKIIDNVGNEYDLNGFTMTVDKTLPELNINDISDADSSTSEIDVNGIVKISGIASDNNGLQSIVLKNLNTDQTVEYKNKEQLNNWSFEINTADLDDKTTYKYEVTAQDKAGNTITKPVDIYVNQDSDRPVINFTTLDVKADSSVNNFYNTKLYGTIFDDDNNIVSVHYKVVDNLEAEDINNGSQWNELKLGNGGTWTINLNEDKQGEQYIIFKINDGTKTFTSTASDKLSCVKIKTEGEKKDDKGVTSLYLRVDTIAPDINEVYYQIVDNTIDYKDKSYISGQGGWKSFNTFTQETLSGIKNKYLYFKVVASDANGIKKVVLESSKASGGFYEFNEPVKKDGKNYYSIIKSPIDISKDYKEKPNEGEEYKLFPVTLKVTDGAGKESLPWSFNLKVDNKAPLLSIDSHQAGDNIRSSFLLKGITTDKNSLIKYQLTTTSERPENWDYATDYFIDGTENNQSWRIYFDKANNQDQSAISADMQMHDLDQKQYFIKLYGDEKGLTLDDKGAIVTKNDRLPYKEFENFYFHFKVSDTLGNTSFNDDFYLVVDPQGDMPVIKLTYPDPNGDPEKDLRVSGIIRLQGESDDDKGLPDLYMQIDPNYKEENGFKPWRYDSEDVLGTNVTASGKTIKNINGDHENLYKAVTIEEDKTGHYYISLGNGLSWTYNLNKFSELNSTNSDNVKIAIRLFAKDEQKNFSSGTEPVILTIDSDAPKIGSLEPFTLNQYGWKMADGSIVYTKTPNKEKKSLQLYTDSGCTKEKSGSTWNSGLTETFSTIDYTEGMWLKGEWWLKGSVEDDGDIGVLTIDSNDITKTFATKINHGYMVNYKVGSKETGKAGVLSYALSASDLQNKNSSKTFTINFDNKAPTIVSDGNKNGMSVVNENGFFTLESEAKEDSGESGFERAVFYFTDSSNFEDSINNNIYDAYIKKGFNKNKQIINESLKFEDNLFWTVIKNCTVSGNNIKISKNANLHTGSLLKINGAFYTVKTKSEDGTSITINPKLPENTNNITINAAIGHVVDHIGTESKGKNLITGVGNSDFDGEYYGYYSNMPDDDGDKMIEKVSTIGTSTIWNGSINSNNLPDGPITINYVVFDKAGNVSQLKSVTGKVKNNAPRIASVSIWNDHNGNKTFNADDGTDEGELQTFYNNEKTRVIKGKSVKRATEATDKLVISGNRKDAANGGSAAMTIKNEFKFVPEIVGGNGKLWYKSEIQESNRNVLSSGSQNPVPLNNLDGKQMEGFAHGVDDVPGDNDGYLELDDEQSEYVEGRKDGSIEVSTSILSSVNHSSSIEPVWFNYTIFDSTGSEEEKSYSKENSLSATFQIALNVQYNDLEAPTVKINPLYWNSYNDNSLLKDENGNFTGHVELYDMNWDWKDNLPEKYNSNQNLIDEDPKVSGWISITGEADDNIQLSELFIKFPGINNGDYQSASTYNKKTGEWTETPHEDNDNWKFIAEDIAHEKQVDGKTETWHTVKWTFNVNTAIVDKENQVGLDQCLYVKAKDSRGNGYGLETVSDKIPELKLDVVPYITGIDSILSKKKVNNPSVYSRTSSKGNYIVNNKEKITFTGFNLGKSNIEKSYSASEKVNFENNSIPAFNNFNNNDALGNYEDEYAKADTVKTYERYKHYYNRQPNGDNNNLLTDDVIFDVWEVNSEAALPIRGKISEPVMRINPKTDMIGFAFVSGPADFAMSNGQTSGGNSYERWQGNYATFANVSFVYDANGYAHGTATGIDTCPFGNQDSLAGRFSYFTSKWGPSGTDSEGNYNGGNAIRLEAVGVPGDNKIIVGGQVNPGYIIDEQRIKSPSIATTVVDGTTSTYLAYYDSIQNQIRFRTDIGVIDSKNNNGDFYDNFGLSGSGNSIKVVEESSTDKFSLIAGKDYQKDREGNKISIDYWGTPSSTDFYDTGYKAGPFVAIDAIAKGTELNGSDSPTASADIVVAVWYDGNDCYYSSIVGPTANGDDMGGTANKAACWATPKKIFRGAGEYCTIKTDAKGGIHIAAYDLSGADLKYAYLPKYDSKYNEAEDAVTVDSYAITGTHISIDVGKKSSTGSFIPYISYYMPSIQSVRMAYLVADENNAVNYKASGVNSKDEFTGNWEVTTIPSDSRIKDDNVNVGLWKDTTGLIKDSTTGTVNSATSTEGTCYGNGTNNPVVGYAISKDISGAIETAQMK